jgi:hypothetical protein
MVAGVGPLQILRMPKLVFRHFFRVNWVAFISSHGSLLLVRELHYFDGAPLLTPTPSMNI